MDGHVKISDLGVSVEVGDTFQISGQAGKHFRPCYFLTIQKSYF